MDLGAFEYNKAEVGKIEVSSDIEERDGLPGHGSFWGEIKLMGDILRL